MPERRLHFYEVDPNYSNKSQLPEALGKCEFGPGFEFPFSNQSSAKMAILCPVKTKIYWSLNNKVEPSYSCYIFFPGNILFSHFQGLLGCFLWLGH